MREQHTFAASLGELDIDSDAVRPVEKRRDGVVRHALSVRIQHKLGAIGGDFRAFVRKTQRAARVNRKNVVLACFDVPLSNHLDELGTILVGDIVVLGKVFGDVVQLPASGIQFGQRLGVHGLAEEFARLGE